MPRDVCRVMDLLLYFWIAFMGTVPPAVCSFAIGWFMYEYGKKQGRMMYDTAKKEIQEYVKTELLKDLTTAVTAQLNGILGPLAKSGTAEGRAATLEYAQQNPGIASLLTQVAGRGAARWLGKQFGVPKEVSDMLAGASIGGRLPTLQHKRQKEDLTFDVHGPQVP